MDEGSDTRATNPDPNPTGRRDVLKLGLLGGLTGLLGFGAEDVAAASTAVSADEIESLCVFQGPLENGEPAKETSTGCAYCYIEYTDSGGPGALWISTRDMAGWELLHSTTQELRLEDRTGGSQPEVGIVNEGGKLYKVTYQ